METEKKVKLDLLNTQQTSNVFSISCQSEKSVFSPIFIHNSSENKILNLNIVYGFSVVIIGLFCDTNDSVKSTYS